MSLFERTEPGNAIALGDRARALSDWETAARHYRAALAREPNNAPIWVQYGHTLKESGSHSQAEVAYRRAAELEPNAADPHLQLGILLRLQGRKAEAEAAFLRALALDPRLTPTEQDLAEFGWTAERLAELRRSLVPTRPPPRRRSSLITLADQARDLGQWESAAGLYGKALARNPRRPDIWVQYGHMLKETGRASKAERAYRQALAYNGKVGDTHLQLGHVLKLQGRVEEARAAYLRAFALEPSMEHPIAELTGLGWPRDAIDALRGLCAPDDASVPAGVASVSDLHGEPSATAPRETGQPNRSVQAKLYTVLQDEFGADCAWRVQRYFELIANLEGTRGDPGARKEQLAGCIQRMRRLSENLGGAGEIEATIVMPAFEHVEHTIASVISLLEHISTARYEIIVGDNVSSDETAAVFKSVGGIVRCITHPANEGFIRNCNQAAQHARGRHLVLLNNDTVVLDGWLDELLKPFARFRKVGLTGSKLLFPDGTLQEAGGIIWRDASGWNFGRGKDPTLPEFNYVKDVDYVSGASIAVKTDLWREVGGFDEHFAPAYFDDSDLAFTLRSRGWRTLYAPASQVIHHEGLTHGRDPSTGVKASQVANRAKFVEKWQSGALSAQFDNGKDVFLARDRSKERKHVLVIDHYVPQPDRDAGSRTISSYIRMFVDAGLQVSFWPDNLSRDRHYAKLLQDVGVEVLYGAHLAGRFDDWIKENGRYLDYAFLSRAPVAAKYIHQIRDHSRAKVLYYGHDLSYARLAREYELTQRQEVRSEMHMMRSAEHRVWANADVIYFPAADEVETVKTAVADKAVRKFPIYIYPDKELEELPSPAGVRSTRTPTILFVAGFRHRPNVDGAIWFVRDILPSVRRELPQVKAIIAGSFPPPSVTRLASDAVIVTDAVSDQVLQWLYQNAGAVAVPLRYGGGVKGKMIEAMRFGAPVVATESACQGLPDPGELCAVADNPTEFAAQLVSILNGDGYASQRAAKALSYVAREYAYSVVAGQMAEDIPELTRLVDGGGTLGGQ